ncbi:cache domain-containing sensor histidine kinase [Salisediminibacterium selenitireducens]|uniref:Integral membrane sensor signal transduction histidine kinase n=1 Tax=Bacillus selenitireducens (strain ATCC 700615 / DSM 15326 / MLS10) TaxID=439292 RepID=D6XZ36_BACIE|nr:sensor histidine kinase [Salisediminibacterium selenitireducens]ADI00321.1 integral membrane sensor signal transduction histidine kinase [[Bacillus] selenitireducens MLS10]
MRGPLKIPNTLRNQILILFSSVMVVVLLTAGLLTYNLVTDILKENAENQLEQTAQEQLNRIDSQFETIDLITTQIATNPSVQSILTSRQDGLIPTFTQRQSMQEIVNNYQAYTSGMPSFEMYFPNYARLYPLNELQLPIRMDSTWVELAEEENGRIIWAGSDPLDENAYLTIRQINLIDRDFSRGGYLVTKIDRNYFNLESRLQAYEETDNLAILFDQTGSYITSNLEEDVLAGLNVAESERTVQIEGAEYLQVQVESAQTGFMLSLYTPLNNLLAGITGIGTAILIAGSVGLMVFTVTSFHISQIITAPLERLTAAMKRARQGELETTPDISSTTEMNELNHSYNDMVERTNHLIREVYEKELMQNQAELKALQAQINPHFLFNTLEALYWSIDEKDPESAEMIITMSDLFRYTISDSASSTDWVTLEEEAAHIEDYLRIMQLRFGDEMTWTIDLPTELAHLPVPKLLIQPIVENAVLHGISQKSERGHIAITVQRMNESPKRIAVTVTDDGVGMTEATKEALFHENRHTNSHVGQTGKRIAMINCLERLIRNYPDHEMGDAIQVVSEPGQGTTVTLCIPEKGGTAS